MKLENIIYDIREGINAFSNDSEIDNRHLIHLLNVKRAKYLRQELNNFQRTTDISVVQTFCIELEKVSIDECSTIIDCEFILRTKVKIPKPLELHIKSAITSVKPTEKLSKNFNFTTKQKVIYSKYSPFAKSIHSFLDNDGYIYVVSDNILVNMIDCITISGVFEDPISLKDYKKCCNCNTENNECFNDLYSDYPLQPHYIDLIKQEIVNELIGKEKIKEDKENNSNDQE